jgi:hypothetical protein
MARPIIPMWIVNRRGGPASTAIVNFRHTVLVEAVSAQCIANPIPPFATIRADTLARGRPGVFRDRCPPLRNV